MRRMIGWGIFLVILGAWIWLSALGVPYISFAQNWPLLVVAFGVWLIVHRLARHSRRRRSSVQVLSDLEQGRIDVEKAITEIRRSR
ncbi:hypothetical protein FJY68_04325 [candidate division WOR-3 bacterium]|uniref:LiaF transmembrane domain-containing protein n=1 Tax=candidate division WOR-3 bacterium TaxID=2052148 RepID=A0A938BTN1_UNCW3|nr:hypothetical protein [candidate division WOR-3 bacterium]